VLAVLPGLGRTPLTAQSTLDATPGSDGARIHRGQDFRWIAIRRRHNRVEMPQIIGSTDEATDARGQLARYVSGGDHRSVEGYIGG
jgi:hypothetical protein